MVLPQQGGILAQDLRLLEGSNDRIPDLTLARNVLIGDLGLAREIRAGGLSDVDGKRVWRLLANDTNGWLYFIRTMPSVHPQGTRPLSWLCRTRNGGS